MSRSTQRAAVALIGLLALAATACSTSSRPGSGSPLSSSPSGATTAKLSATATGVTAASIKVGFTYPDLDALAKSGLIKVAHGPYAQIIKALVDDVNAHGGVNGRTLDLVTAKYSVLGNTEALAVCTQMTEDNKVFAVLGGFTDQAANLCVVQQHSTLLVGSFTGVNATVLAKARAPWIVPSASDERGLKALVKLLADQGRLRGKKIAVYGQTPESKGIVDLAVKALDDAGDRPAETAVNDVEATDAQAFNSQDKVLAARFKDRGIDAVFLVGGAPTGANWDAIGWHPAIYATSTSVISAAAFTNPFDRFPFVGGVAVSANPDAGYDTPAMRHCRAVWKQATGKDIETTVQENAQGKTSGNTAMSAACTALTIFVDAAEAAGADLTTQGWQKGVESIGTIALPTAPVASFGPGKPDGQDSFQLEQQDPTWKSGDTKPEFIPIGTPITLTK